MTETLSISAATSLSEQEKAQLQQNMSDLCEKLYPICRSITGPGVRETLDILAEHIELERFEIPTGTQVFDWVIPMEWHCNKAYIENSKGDRVVDFEDHTLHVMSYSTAVDQTMNLTELQKHLFSLPHLPDLIPYRTSYYDDNWGFCITDKLRKALPEDDYKVVIDSSHYEGSLTYAEYYKPGTSDEDLLISTHICHPSLANDNLSGMAVACFLAQLLEQRSEPLHYGVRIIFIPGTIGSIAWLAENFEKRKRIVAGTVLSGIGDSGDLTYKLSRQADGLFDQLIPILADSLAIPREIREFVPYGYDERQFCSPGINLPIGCLMRTPYGEYDEYHSSGDNLQLLKMNQLVEALVLVLETVLNAQHIRKFVNLVPHCEPQLGRRGLYEAIGGDNDQKNSQMAMLWMLAYSDGQKSTLDICRLSGIPMQDLSIAAERLAAAETLREVPLSIPVQTSPTPGSEE